MASGEEYQGEYETVFTRVDQLEPNPFRRLDEYPIVRAKVDALKSSILTTGFWPTIVGRSSGVNVQIAFGHQRRQALLELDPARVIQVHVADLTNESMIKMMANENMQEWGSSVAVETETVRAVLDAFGKGQITLPPVLDKTPQSAIRYTLEELTADDLQALDSGMSPEFRGHPYTKSTVAEFLGWITTDKEGNRRISYGCETAFLVLDAIAAGLITRGHIQGMSRNQARELIQKQKGARDFALHKREEILAQLERQRAALKDVAAQEAEQRRAASSDPDRPPIVVPEADQKPPPRKLQVFQATVDPGPSDPVTESAQERPQAVQEQEEAPDEEDADMESDTEEQEQTPDDTAKRLIKALECFFDEIEEDVETLAEYRTGLSAGVANKLWVAIRILVELLEKTQPRKNHFYTRHDDD